MSFFQNFDLIARNFREKKAKLQKEKKNRGVFSSRNFLDSATVELSFLFSN